MHIVEYRGWDTENKVMRDWFYFSRYTYLLFECICEKEFPYLYACGEPKRLIPMVSIGKKDCNGKMIYEHDIVKIKDTDDNTTSFNTYEVIWDKNICGFILVNQYSDISIDMDSSLIEIIGNIFETPSYLK